MKKQTNPSIKAHLLRSAFYLLLLMGLCAIPFALAKRSFDGRTTAATQLKQTRTLTFADRVAYQRAIEQVYWRHRDWPGADGSAKPSLDQLMPQAKIEKKVEDYLGNSQALEDYWHQSITPEQLQAEMERMASHTKRPEVLRELFSALGNDPYVIAECLARPALADRLARNFYAHDQRLHGALRQRAQAELANQTVAEMQQASGTYSEIEWARSDDESSDTMEGQPSNVVSNLMRGVARNQAPQAPGYTGPRKASNMVKMNGSEWTQNVQKLATIFGNAHPVAEGARSAQPRTLSGLSSQEPAKATSIARIKTGQLSPLQEDEDRYYATAVLEKGKDRLKVATVAWLKQPFESWRGQAESQPRTLSATSAANYNLPADNQCTDDTWSPTFLGAPEPRYYHTAVWTGSEMIIWGGYSFVGYLNTGRRYDPATDSWTATSTINVPDGRYLHTAVLTGSTMIVWGGQGNSGYLNTGGRYDPATDSWTATSTTNAPEARYYHTAVSTGSTMIIWGGGGNSSGYLNTGGRYDSATDSWMATSLTNAPEARYLHTAVWTGTTMIVWGGLGNINGILNTGRRYNPTTNTWTPTSLTNAPEARYYHSAVWTGSEMIVWGGQGNVSGILNTGGRYNPTTNSWTATSLTNAPEARYYHSAVWTGSEMIVWGGQGNSGSANTGGRYNPGTNSWTATSLTNAPEARYYHSAVWTGSEMIVWGGQGSTYLDTGGRYNPATDSWTSTNTSGAPEARYYHTAIWTGSEMIVWGGQGGLTGIQNTGGRYDPATDSWTATSTTNAPEPRLYHTAVWTGSTMIVWGGGGNSSGYLNTGGRYDLATDSWTATSLTNAPEARYNHTAVWTGSAMIVWGGLGNVSGYLNSGRRYNPTTNTWMPTSLTNAPEARYYHTAVWTGSTMVVWGGLGNINGTLNTGGRYNPTTNSWIATSTTDAPEVRYNHTAVWTDSEMIVWGGQGNSGLLNTGGRYDSATNSWTATNATAPEARYLHTVVWTGSEMIVWGGFIGNFTNTGGRYDPSTDSWTATSTTNAPESRYWHTAIWTGSTMIVWGGYSNGGSLNTGGKYCAAVSASTPTPTPTATATATATVTVTPTPTPTVQVTVQTNPAGLTFTVDGTTYSSTQTFSWGSGSSHTIATTSPQSGGTGVQYAWTRWSDNGAISHTVAPTTNKTYTATFTKQYLLTMVAGTGGRVTPMSGYKNSGATVSITATPTSGYSFSNWTGSGTGSYSGTNNPASITMNGPITETAAFIQNPIQVTVQTSIAGLSFSVDGNTYTTPQTFSWQPGSSHTIGTTSPQNGATGVRYTWASWTGGGAISHTVTPTMNTTYTANFNTQYFLTMAHGAGGTVTPASAWKNSGTVVSIHAAPASGHSFTGWTGSGTGSYSGPNNPASVTMGGPIMETGNFTP